MSSELSEYFCRRHPLALPDFTPSQEVFSFLRDSAKILVIGAGGLGCEILKCLAMMGCGNLSVIDMDIIDLTNLNRQFLFRQSDIGKSKAVVAAETVMKRVQQCKITPHFKRIEDFDEEFYKQFHVVIGGLDSVDARRWINDMLHQLIKYDKSGDLIASSIIPFVDGGTEGLKGNARVIIPGFTGCFTCALDLFPPQTSYPVCTLAHTPRLPEHCIEYIKIVQWENENPFGSEVEIDGDNPKHIDWIFEKAQERAKKFNIRGVTHRLTQGVVKHIIPAVASTNAMIAAVCSTEAIKILTSSFPYLDNFLFISDINEINTCVFQTEKKESCLSCSQRPYMMSFNREKVFSDFIKHIKNEVELKLDRISISGIINDRLTFLYSDMVAQNESSDQTEKSTSKFMNMKISELLQESSDFWVYDMSSPKSIKVRVVSA